MTGNIQFHRSKGTQGAQGVSRNLSTGGPKGSADAVTRVARSFFKRLPSEQKQLESRVLVQRCTFLDKQGPDSVSTVTFPAQKKRLADFRGSCTLPSTPPDPSEGTFPKEVVPSTAEGQDWEFYPEDYLATGEASLWINSKVFGKRTGQKIELRREEKSPEEVGTKDGKREMKTLLVPDEERQNKLNEAFARFKCVLGLTKEDVVRYSMNHNFIEIYGTETLPLKGKYDLLDMKGNRGGLKELLRDRGLSDRKEDVEAVAKKLESLSAEMRALVHRESGGRLRKGKIEIFEDTLPLFSSHSERKDLFVENAKRFGLVDENGKKMTLNERGLSAFTFIYTALILQRMVFSHISKKEVEIDDELLNERIEKNRKETLNKEKKALERFKEVIRNIHHFEDLHLIFMAFASEKRGADFSQIQGKSSAEMAKKFIDYFEQVATNFKTKRERRFFWLFKKKGEIDPENPFYQKMYQMAHRLAGVVFDIREKSLSRMEKIKFFERQTKGPKEKEPQSKFVQFLVHGTLSQGRSGEDIFEEEEWIHRLIQESLREFSEKWPSLQKEGLDQLNPSINVSLATLEKLWNMNLDRL